MHPLAMAHIEALVERGLIEFALIDPGSVNFHAHNDKHRPQSQPALT